MVFLIVMALLIVMTYCFCWIFC